MKDVAAGVVLVHGAWHGAWCWDGVVAELERRRVPASAVALPLSGFADDVAAARQAIEESRPATVVVGHSYGGAVISAAASGLSSVSHLVYVSAFVPDVGEDMTALLAAHGSRLLDSLVITDDGVAVDRQAARGLFFGDTDEETARALVARLRPMPLDGTAVLRCEPAWRSVPSTYLRCTSDAVFPPEAQLMMAARVDEVVDWPTDHSPFATRPRELADLIMAVLPSMET